MTDNTIEVHIQKTCPHCGYNKFKGSFENILFVKCDKCNKIWQYINKTGENK